MLNEERIRLMTKLALYEQGEGKQSLKSTKYFKGDYVSRNIIVSILSGVISFLLLFLVYVLFRINYYTVNISKINVVVLIMSVFIAFIFYMTLYLIISYLVFSVKYRDYRKGLSEYNEDLKSLHRMYKVESKIMEEKGLGGTP